MRVKRATTKQARHRKIRKLTKGMDHARRTRYRLGKQAVIRSLQYAYRDRRNKKRDMRKLWITRINAAVRQEGLTYGNFMNKLTSSNIALNRKILSELSVNYPDTLKTIIRSLK